MLHRMMEAGLARQKNADPVQFRPVLELTSAGVAVMKGQSPPPTGLIDLLPRKQQRAAPSSRAARVPESQLTAPEDDFEPDEATLTRFQRLRALRAELARERQIPAYCICNDRTLKLIARSAPSTPQALTDIKGMGPSKVRLYGDAILSTLIQDR
jgi:ATP-dependent DNA helicase RecQ